MHNSQISPDILQATIDRRDGKRFIFDRIDLAHTAHIIVDLQNGFMEVGAEVEVPVARDIVPNVNAISRAVRQAGGLNVFLRYTMTDADLVGWSTWFSNFFGPKALEGMKRAFYPEQHGWQLWPELDVAGSDLIVDKTRFGGFVPGASDLHEILQARGIRTLIITGTLTNCCCESTARDAMQMNYEVIFVADGNAALSDAAHNATLDSMCGLFADVMTTQEVLGVVNASAQVRHAAE